MSLSPAAPSNAPANEESSLDVSVVVPLYNEEESLPELVEQLLGSLRPTGERFELVLVNDGSSDQTAAVLEQVSQEVPELVGVLLRKNYGQTAAMAAGLMWPVAESSSAWTAIYRMIQQTFPCS